MSVYNSPEGHSIVRCPAQDKATDQDTGNVDGLYLCPSYHSADFWIISSHLLGQSGPLVDQDDDGQVAPHHH